MTLKCFEKRIICSSSGLTYELYMEDLGSVIQFKVEQTSTEEIVLKRLTRNVYSHFMNSQIGREAVPIVEKTVNRSKDIFVSWKCQTSDGVQSSVRCLQLFKDKFQTSLKAGAPSFYPSHVTPLNFSEVQRWIHTISGKTFCAYLPVRFWRFIGGISEKNASSTNRNGQSEGFSRADILQALHESVKISFQNLVKTAVQGLKFRTSDGNKICLYLLDISYRWHT